MYSLHSDREKGFKITFELLIVSQYVIHIYSDFFCINPASLE